MPVNFSKWLQMRSALRWAGVDKAVAYALLMRGWQFVAGPITLLLVAEFFRPQVQGYYYTFASLIALQSFLELGFHVVIMNLASHEWSKLGMGDQNQIVGDEGAMVRLASLGRFVFRWYSMIGILFVVIVGPAGYIFFSQDKADGVSWVQPWTALVLLSAVSLCAVPFHALLEGCNQVTAMNRLRFLQAVTGNLAVWMCIPVGLELWTTVAVAAVKVCWEVYALTFQFREFLRLFLGPLAGKHFDWHTEIWPLQWRIGVQGVLSYFAYWLFNPVMFHYHGSVVAGQMGMTWSIINTLQYGAMAWVQTRAPQFGMLAARQEYQELDQKFVRMTLRSLLFLVAGMSLLFVAVAVLQTFKPEIGDRFLPLDAMIVLGIGAILHHVPNCQAIFIRAHKREMLLVLGVLSSLAIGLSVWLLGSHWGPLGAATGYAIVIAFLVVPYGAWMWMRCRAER